MLINCPYALAEDWQPNDKFLNAKIITSTEKPYSPPELRVKDFYELVKKRNICSDKADLKWKSNEDIISLQIISNLNDPWVKKGEKITQFDFTEIEVKKETVAILLTIDRGKEFTFDNDRFIPSEAVIEMIRFLENQCK